MKENMQRPQAGTVPHWVKNRNRNIELAKAVSRYTREYRGPEKDAERSKSILEITRAWAMEIVLNCDMELEFISQGSEKTGSLERMEK